MTTTPTSGAADLPETRLFTKKPVTIAAIQWTGKNLREVIAFTDGPPDTRTTHAGMAWEAYTDLVARDGLKIYTLEGKMLASPGDWIIRGVKGEYYPCKPDIFEATYSPAALAAGQATAAQAVPPNAITASVMRDDGGEAPAFCLMAAYRSEKDAMDAFALIAAAPAQPAAQQGVAYAERPTSRHAGWVYEEGFLIGTRPLYTADKMHAFADATHTLRASHGQAPASVLHLVNSAFAEIAMAFPKAFALHKVGIADKAVLEALASPATAQADSVQEDAAREAIEKVLALFPFNVPIQKFSVNNGPCLTADNDDEFYSVKRVLAFLTEIKTTLDAARKQGENHDR